MKGPGWCDAWRTPGNEWEQWKDERQLLNGKLAHKGSKQEPLCDDEKQAEEDREC
jgi:hypothetical protein